MDQRISWISKDRLDKLARWFTRERLENTTLPQLRQVAERLEIVAGKDRKAVLIGRILRRLNPEQVARDRNEV